MVDTDSRYSSPDELTKDECKTVESLLRRLADDELIAGEQCIEWAVVAPTIESDVSIASIAQDELGHARVWYTILEDFGYTENDLIYERDPNDFRHSTLVELPVDEGNWAETIVRMYFYDTAEQLRLESLAGSSYRPLGTRVQKILDEEDYHVEHAENWLERLAANDDGQTRLQNAVDRFFGPAQTLFAGPDDATEHGFRTESLSDLRSKWLDIVEPKLTSLELTVPADDMPEPIGRDGNHTEHWRPLFDEIIETYHDLDRSEPTKIMDESLPE